VDQVGEETGATFVSPYNDERIVAGQGTAALELVDSVPDLDEVWVPVGGGGLASGCVVALQDHRARVYGAEPELADDAYRSLASKTLQPALPPTTIADGLRTALGTITFGILNAYRMDIRLVSEAAIVAAQKLVFECLKIVVEPSSAVPLAALLDRARDRERQFEDEASRVGVILTGGNLEFQGR
ncbi:MAG: pyridoxal-phosphate dependent enzyme, partial [Gammaproteobacteria bacterium]|nr:pyridoxal-phosphate dependent enzyme [Gammaproteobacteria bacterium]